MSMMSPLLQTNLLCCKGVTDYPPITKTGRCHDVKQSSMVYMMLRVELLQNSPHNESGIDLYLTTATGQDLHFR